MAMQSAILNFVNLGRQDAFISVTDDEGAVHFIAKLAWGETTRQYTPVGAKWMVVSSSSFGVNAEAGDRVCLISERGVEMVEKTRAIASEEGGVPLDTSYPSQGGGASPIRPVRFLKT